MLNQKITNLQYNPKSFIDLAATNTIFSLSKLVYEDINIDYKLDGLILYTLKNTGCL